MNETSIFDQIMDEATVYLKLIIFDYHQTVRSIMYIAGLMVFLVSLKIGFIKYQLRRLAWSVIVIVFVFVLAFVQIYNLFKGIYWVVFPMLCVLINSSFASVIGLAIGRTSLNKKNMPTKTWEGYIGGILLTAIWAYFTAGYLSQY